MTLTLPVEPRAARWQQVLPLLRRAILSREIAPGVRLVPEQIAAASGVSRGPVTDAIRRLSEEGLVTIAANGRPFVRGLTMKDFHDLNAFRANLEVFAVRGALQNHRTPNLEALRWDVELMHRYESRETIEQLADADVAFHQHLIGLADNIVADRAFATIAEFARSLLSVSDWLITPDQKVAYAHERVVDALAARDLPSLEAAIADHYRLSSETMTAAGLVRS